MISFNQTCTYLRPADKVSFRLHKPPSTWASSLHHRHPLPYWSFPSAYGQAKIAPTQTNLKSQAVVEASSPHRHFSFSASLLIRPPKGSRLLCCSVSSPPVRSSVSCSSRSNPTIGVAGSFRCRLQRKLVLLDITAARRPLPFPLESLSFLLWLLGLSSTCPILTVLFLQNKQTPQNIQICWNLSAQLPALEDLASPLISSSSTYIQPCVGSRRSCL